MTPNRDSFSAIVLAAGKGTRMYSTLPKVLHTVCGLSLIERTLRALAPLQLVEIVIVVGYEAALVEKEINAVKNKLKLKTPIKIALQAEQLGTGHATRIGAAVLSEKVSATLILPGDVPLLNSPLLEGFAESFSKDSAVVSCLTTNLSDPFGYGRIVRNDSNEVVAIVEEKDCSAKQRAIGEINSSIYLAEISFLKNALANLSPQNAQSEYYLTDIVAEAVKAGGKVSATSCADSLKVSGANNRLELNKLESYRRLELANQLMLSGVTLEDPFTTYLDEDVTVGQESFIGAAVKISGKSVIGRGCRIEGSSQIKNTNIGDNTVIKSFCYLDSANIGSACQVGPSAHLRPASVLEDEVKIGNFVETKNVKMKRGAKANHLTYLGDATVGEAANVGAGTITCNYDGKKKSQTTIEAGAFIGSNSALVAPVTIGAGAFVGAGSTITKDVPDHALAIARSKQVNLENRAKGK